MAAWDKATIKEMLGIDPGDTSSDDAIDQVMAYVLSAVETALHRQLQLVRETFSISRVEHHQVFLPRFPVLTIHEINGGDVSEGLPHGWSLDTRRGRIDVTADYLGDPLDIDYEGGFDPLPPDLLRVLLEAFNTAWAASDSTTGLPDPNATTVVSGSGEVQSVSLSDFGTVRWDVAAQSASADVQAGQQANYGWLAPWASILDFYRSEYGTDMGLA